MLENKIQRILRKFKTRLSTQQYYQLHPTGSFPGKIFSTAKLQKLPINGTVQDLPIWPIVSNIGTASHHLAKYIAKMLSSLAYSEYTIRRTIDQGLINLIFACTNFCACKMVSGARSRMQNCVCINSHCGD